ncbi:MAG: hypothetical protein M0036_16430 [Desulfobacteraceae bacterium]|nr:hypothetical protein [Desulfobacteraceae bacterium]
MTVSHSSIFTWYVGHPPTAVTRHDPQWPMPLPLDRAGAGGSICTPTLTYGQYFMAVQDFLSKEEMALLRRVAELESSTSIANGTLDRVQVHLIKHGAFYHPALVTAWMGPRKIAFILNVAVSAAGRARLAAEAVLLDDLHGRWAQSYVPRVFGSGAGSAAGGDSLPMFAAQWFEGFYELHLSRQGSSQSQQWSVWDTDGPPWYLSPKQTATFFRQAVCILTRYFDPHTLSAIMEWHHAAGDFIVGKQGDDIAVRLITVRRYDPLLTIEEHRLDLRMLLNALTIFLLKTTLWMRLDRIDGVGELSWAEGDVATPMWRGFMQGIGQMAAANGFPDDFATEVARYLRTYSFSDLLEVGANLLVTMHPELAEAKLIRRHLSAHVQSLVAAIHAHVEKY